MSNSMPTIPADIKNPFSDSQARNYSDYRIAHEFCPVQLFWSLFNDQHEIIVGTRGCGKTLLMKMMRFSVLRRITDPKAKEMIEQKNYISFYVPMHLEYIKRLSNIPMEEEKRIQWFRFSFNCVLAKSVLTELKALTEDVFPDDVDRYKQEYYLSESIGNLWGITTEKGIYSFWELSEAVDKLYYSTDPEKMDIGCIPEAFLHSLGSPLATISSRVCHVLEISPTWILCIDEAEFLEYSYQKCINTAFRSDTDHIAIKMATLPFYHITKKTLDETIEVMSGQDYKYTIIEYDQDDFISITNKIVETRLKTEHIDIHQLEEFVETLEGDRYIDYFLREMGKPYTEQESIREGIIDQLSEGSRLHNMNKKPSEIKKSVIDKYAPIFYVREIRKKQSGRYIPGWYAGASMVRRVAQGNPRIFIRIMNDLFSEYKGKMLPIPLKVQHRVIKAFAESFCNETGTLEVVGPEAKERLDFVSKYINKLTHSHILVQTGLSFMLGAKEDFSKHRMWLEKSIAFSRVEVDNSAIINGLEKNTKYQLANLYAVKYWLPMRSQDPRKIDFCTDHSQEEKETKKVYTEQISMF